MKGIGPTRSGIKSWIGWAVNDIIWAAGSAIACFTRGPDENTTPKMGAPWAVDGRFKPGEGRWYRLVGWQEEGIEGGSKTRRFKPLNNNIYLARPPRGGWLHRGSRLRVACMPVVSLGSLTPCSVTPSLTA
jgi:hypothetical protein